MLGLLWAMDVYPDVAMLSAEAAVLDADRDAALEQLRRRLAVDEGSEADQRLRAAVDDLLARDPRGHGGPGRGPASAGHRHVEARTGRSSRAAPSVLL